MDYLTIIVHEKFNHFSLSDFFKMLTISKSLLYRLEQNHCVTVNDDFVPFESILKTNDIITIDVSMIEHRDFLSDNESIEVLYEDSDFLIVNKPCGIIIHPANKEEHQTLVNRISRYYELTGLNRQIRYCHRLDKETTGAIMIAKHFLVHAFMANHWNHDHVKRDYLALIQGHLDASSGVWSYPIGKDRHVQNKYRVSQTGDSAITKYQVVKEYADYSLVRLTLETGKTHQIRVHCSYIGHPLLGDQLYGGSIQKIKRTALHSERIQWINPFTQTSHQINAPIPEDIKKLL